MDTAPQFGKARYRLSNRACAASISQMEMIPKLARPGLFGD
jgi:hypothetical protein